MVGTESHATRGAENGKTGSEKRTTFRLRLGSLFGPSRGAGETAGLLGHGHYWELKAGVHSSFLIRALLSACKPSRAEEGEGERKGA